MNQGKKDRAVGSLLGLAVGDALGTTVEFSRRGEFEPVVDMVGGGPFRLPAGAWTDDTSMALCLADSLIAAPGFDPRDLMDRFIRWWKEGQNSVTGKCFDIGIATRKALSYYQSSGDPFAGNPDPDTAGNGSIMRLAPAAIRWHGDPEQAAELSRRQSRTTHAALAAVEGCALLAEILVDGIATGSRDVLLQKRFVSRLRLTQRKENYHPPRQEKPG